MFFIVSKILHFLIEPINWILILAVLALVFKRKRIVLFKSLCILFFVLSNGVIINVLLGQWELSGKTEDEITNVKYGVVLGGMSSFDEDRSRLSIRRGADRIWQAIDLYRKGKIDKIVLSGANGHLLNTEYSESVLMSNYLINNCLIPQEDILIENKSKNTFQNAQFTRNELPKIKTIVLITSARHMRRSLACFEKVGFKCIPYSTDYMASKLNKIDVYLPSLGHIMSWRELLHEITGYISYSLIGYI